MSDETSDSLPDPSATDHDSQSLRLESGRLVLRTGNERDRPEIVALFACPGVRRWWGSQDEDDIDEVIDRPEPEVTVLVIEHAGAVIGVVQFHEEDDPMYRHAGIDIAIHDDHQRQGFGTEAIQTVVDHLFANGHHRIVIDPNAANEAAIAAYASLGFQPVGTMRQYEWSEHEERWTDGLLMELLANE